MNKDAHLIFEAYVSRQLAASDFEKNINVDFSKIPVCVQKFYRSFIKYIPDEVPGRESLTDINNSLQNYREDAQTKQLPDVPAGKNEKAILNDLVSFGILVTKGEEKAEGEEPKETETLDADDAADEGPIDVKAELGFDPGQIQ